MIEYPFMANHSTDPNMSMDHEYIVTEKARLVELTILKNVKRKNELLVLYGTERWQNPVRMIPVCFLYARIMLAVCLHYASCMLAVC